MSFSYIRGHCVISRLRQTKAHWLASWLTAPVGVAVATADERLITPHHYRRRVRRFSQKSPLHLLVCAFSSSVFHLKHHLLCCFLLFYVDSAGSLFLSCVAPFVFSLFAAFTALFLFYILSLMILTVGQSITVSTINPSLLPLFLLLSFSITMWGYEIRSPLGEEKHIFFCKKETCAARAQEAACVITDTQTHTEMQSRNEIAMERWIRFIASLEVAITAKTDRQRRWDRNTIREKSRNTEMWREGDM